MQINSPTLFVEIDNYDLIFIISDKNKDDNFNLIHTIKAPAKGIKENRIIDLDLANISIQENIYKIEKKINYTFKEVVLVLNSFHFSLINFTGFRKLNGAQLDKNKVTYILNTLKSKINEIEENKTILHIFNVKYLLDKKKIENLPIGLFGDFYSQELSFFLIEKNDLKNLKSLFNKSNLKIKKIISKNFLDGANLINKNSNLETFIKIKINEKNSEVIFFSNSALKFVEKFNFGSNLLINDISKILDIKNENIEKILLNLKFSNLNLDKDFIEREYFDGQNFRKIKKKLIYDIAKARIEEIAEIIFFKNINLANLKEKIYYFFRDKRLK